QYGYWLTGGYAEFSATLSADFDESYQHNTFYEFTRVQNDILTHKLVLQSDMDYLRSLLRPEIKQKIESGDPVELFSKYGSHYGCNLKIGGRIIYSASTNKLIFNRTMDLKALAEISYKELVNASESMEFSSETSQFRDNSNCKFVVQGGIPDIVGNVLNEDNFNRWRATIPDNPAFIAFNDDEEKSGYDIFLAISDIDLVHKLISNLFSLDFIGDLASTQKRRDELLEAYRQWAKSEKITLPKDKGPFLEGKMAEAHYLYNDRGTRAIRDIYIHQPDVGDGKEWKFLGQSYLQKPQLTIREKSWAKGVLVDVPDVDSGVTIWSRWDEYFGIQVTFWHPQAPDPENYVTLGSFMKSSYGQNIDGLVAVHKDLCKKSTYDEYIWDDTGSREESNCAVWTIKDAYNINAFIAADNYNSPNPDLIWVLKEEVVEMLDN
ncbi:11058_t:CDS:2, partial [Dentiscutata erythropus]